MRTRAGSAAVARLRSSEAVPASAQCRSSRNSTTGAASLSAASRSATAANSRNRSVSRSADAGVGQRPRPGRPAPARAGAGSRPWRATWACEHLDGRGGHEVAERVDERAGTGERTSSSHRPIATVAPASNQRRSACATTRGLADAGLAADEHGASLAAVAISWNARSSRPSSSVRPTNDGLVGGQARREGRGRRLGEVPHDLHDVDGAREALELVGAGVAEPGRAGAAGQGLDDARGEDLPAVGEGAQAGGLHDGLAVAVAVLEAHVADGQADADRQGRAGPAAGSAGGSPAGRRGRRPPRRRRRRTWP